MSPPFPGSVGGVVAVWDADDLSLSDGDGGVTDMTLEPRQSITIRKFSGQWHLISSAIAT